MPAHTDSLVSLAAGPTAALAWFCLRTHVKHEHVAARHLRQIEHVEVFNPRIRFARATRTGAMWIVEALFPSYLFARFAWEIDLARVSYSPGVSGVVHFGARWPTIPDAVIDELRSRLGPADVHVLKDVAPGDAVQIAGGILHGLEAVVTQVMPGRQRVLVLMDFLGRQTAVELPLNRVAKLEVRL